MRLFKNFWKKVIVLFLFLDNYSQNLFSNGNIYDNFLQNNTFFAQILKKHPSIGSNSTLETWSTDQSDPNKDSNSENSAIRDVTILEDLMENNLKSKIFDTNFNLFYCDNMSQMNESEQDFTYLNSLGLK